MRTGKLSKRGRLDRASLLAAPAMPLTRDTKRSAGVPEGDMVTELLRLIRAKKLRYRSESPGTAKS